MEFKKLELSDKEWVETLLRQLDFRGCDYSFKNLYIWRTKSKIYVAEKDGMLFIKSKHNRNGHTIYTYPAGNGDLKTALYDIIEAAEEEGTPFVLRGISKEGVKNIERVMPGKFEFTENRDEAEYIYTVEKLSSLAGKKYHGKRNHIARFMDNDNWHYEDMSRKNIDDCMKMNKRWCELTGCDSADADSADQCAVKEAFNNFEALGLKGGVLYLNDEVAAFTIGAPINSDTFGVHIEKADHTVQGAYPMINREFVRANMSGFTYINREEDMGEEGLRKAKLSYYPEFLLEKYTAVLKQGEKLL